MACNTCSRSFSFLRSEKGCPGCGFSYCSKCLNNTVFLEKLNATVKVCAKCSKKKNNEPKKVEPPDAYYKRIGAMNDSTNKEIMSENITEQEIHNRLKKLKEDKQDTVKSSNEEIIKRLQNLRSDTPSTSTTELELRLANIKGVPISAVQSQPVLPGPDLRTEQEQADDLLKQYMAQTNIDTKYKDKFEDLVNDIETRLKNLKGAKAGQSEATVSTEQVENEDEIIRKIIEKAKAESTLDENEICDSVSEELPFCEICNEDANMRCLGCKYLFCKRCFLEHKDDDDGCDKYEIYKPKNI